jgi:hypothetical protein
MNRSAHVLLAALLGGPLGVSILSGCGDDDTAGQGALDRESSTRSIASPDSTYPGDEPSNVESALPMLQPDNADELAEAEDRSPAAGANEGGAEQEETPNGGAFSAPQGDNHSSNQPTPGASSGGGGANALSCDEIFACFSDCQSGDRECTDACFERGTAAGQLQVQGIGDCMTRNHCQDDACITARCNDEVTACQESGGAAPATPAPPAAPGNQPPPGLPGGAGNGGGAMSCVQIFECFRTCPEGSRVCTDSCMQQGEPASQALVESVGDCIEQNGCQDDPCVERMCAIQLQGCGFAAAGGGAGAVELCGDGQDNDRDGMTDCNDADCQLDPACAGGAAPAGGGVCEAVDNIGFGQFQGTTNGAGAGHRGTCGGQGNERIHALRLDASETICITTAGSAIDTVLYVRANACHNAAGEVACNDDTRGVQSQVELRGQAGMEYFVFVDGYMADGNYVLNVERGACQVGW